jgi:serine phosphatase RsbU (regulator of sigma subunit)
LIDHQAIRIPPGGALLLYTDGATDANNVQGDYFGNERLESALTAHHTGTAQQICDQILDEILDYQGAAAQVDDITLVAIRSK